ncbi:LPD7 domain-containing protein [Pantoea sp. AMG 501]|uniref:LPD7 domain-containing protein n=1 Tax=Pantoea sp. AMG 501 TaxID=2008894 RepID=UPI000B5A7FD1|nr:LPD7 domain-containing protein [Pantoea sp. AMG 501]OWY74689.1 DNA primase [Pantoea sp. AMG 501]
MSNPVPEKRIWLAVPHDKRHEAKDDAGKLADGRNAIQWSQEDELWYARPGTDVKRIRNWLPDPSIRGSGGDPQEEFLDALTAAGLIIEGLPVMDGEIHRVSVTDGPAGNGDGVYRGFLNGRKPGGWYINYWTAPTHKDITKWKASGTGGEADPVARLHMRALARQSKDDSARKLAETHARQTARAKWLYNKLPAADPNHPYLVRKGVAAESDMRQTNNGALVIPLYDVNGVFRTLQYIPPEGEKTLYEKAPKVGNFFVVGGRLKDGEPVYYAEGYATAKSLSMLTGYPVVMTIDAGNMLNVARVLSERYPTSPHIFMADNDHAKPVNTGLIMARQAAINTGGEYILPDLTDAERKAGFTDFNDIHLSRGEESLRATLMPQITQALERLKSPENPMSTPDSENVVSDLTTSVSPDVSAAPEPPPVAAKAARGRPGAAKEKASQILEMHAQGIKPADIAAQLSIGQTSVYRIIKATGADSSVLPSEPEKPTAMLPPSDTQVINTSPEMSDAPLTVDDPSSAPAVSLAQVSAATESLAPVLDASAQSVAIASVKTPNTSPVTQAVTLEASGKRVAAIAAEMNIGVGEAFRLLQSQGAEAARESLRISNEHSAVPPSEQAKVSSDTESESTSTPKDFGEAFGEIAGQMRALLRDADKLNPDELFYDASALMVQWRVLAGVWEMSDEAALGREHFPGKECEALEAELQALTDPLSETTAPDPAETPAQPAARETAEDGILTGPRRIVPSEEEIPVPEALKHIDLDRLLTRVTSEMAADGKSAIFRLDGEHAFTDLGGRLVMATGASDHEEKVLAALLTAAQYYHGKIELTGSDAFKAFATDIIVKHKLNVTMKVASQQLALEKARLAAGQPASPADAVKGNQVPPQFTVPSEPVPGETLPVNTAASPDVDRSVSTAPLADKPEDKGVKSPAVTTSQGMTTTTPPLAAKTGIRPEIHTPAEKAQEPVTGKVIAAGQAPFRFDDRESMSSYITLHTREGTQTYWGKELEGLIKDTRLQNGSIVALQWEGKKPVNIQVPVKNDDGVVIGYETQAKHRNQWTLTPIGGERVRTGGDDLIRLTAVDAARYTEIQRMVVKGLDIDMPPPPPVPADGLFWIRPDGQGSLSSGDPQTAPRPAFNNDAGAPVMATSGEDGRLDVYLVKGDGDYLQGLVRQDGHYHHVLVSLPGSDEAPAMVINRLTPDGAVPMGNGHGINEDRGKPVPREYVVLRLNGDDKQRFPKLVNPASLSPALHARLGYDERWKPEVPYPKERPAAAPQAAPVAPNRPA